MWNHLFLSLCFLGRLWSEDAHYCVSSSAWNIGMFNRLFIAINTKLLPFIAQLGLQLKTIKTDSLKSDSYRISSELSCMSVFCLCLCTRIYAAFHSKLDMEFFCLLFYNHSSKSSSNGKHFECHHFLGWFVCASTEWGWSGCADQWSRYCRAHAWSGGHVHQGQLWEPLGGSHPVGASQWWALVWFIH